MDCEFTLLLIDWESDEEVDEIADNDVHLVDGDAAAAEDAHLGKGVECIRSRLTFFSELGCPQR